MFATRRNAQLIYWNKKSLRAEPTYSSRKSYYTCAQSGRKKPFVCHSEVIDDGDNFYIQEGLSGDIEVRGISSAQRAVAFN